MTTDDDTNDDARFAVLDMALAEQLGRDAPPDLWPALAARPARVTAARNWLAAALVLLGTGIVVATALLQREPEPAVAVQPFRIDVDPNGPATLAELQARFAAARTATVTADATWSAALGEFVQLVRFGGLERWFKSSLSPELDPDAIQDALRRASEGEVLSGVVWTHAVSVGQRATKAVVLVQLRGGDAQRVAFASPRGAIALQIASFPSDELRTVLTDVEQKTIAALGVVIGADGFRTIQDAATALRLHRVPAARVNELARFSKLQNVEATDSPAWHDTAVLRTIARLPIRSLVLRPDLLGADAYPVLGSIASLHELHLFSANWFELISGTAPIPQAPSLDDAAILALRDLRQLSELTIAGGSCGDVALRGLGALPELRRLSLLGCPRIAGDSLAAFTNVSHLALYACSGLREDFPAAAARMPKLTNLTVHDAGCRVRLPALRDAKELSSLHVRGGIVVDELRFLAECPKLQTLTLQVEPPLRDADLIWLHGLRQLRTLYVGGDAITADGRAALKAALPKCTMKTEPW